MANSTIQAGGVTVTLGVAYLTVLAHERNRQAQAQALRSQSRVLNGLLEPVALPPPQSRAELAREARGSFVETAKDRWNSEIENAVRWVQRKDWSDVRDGVEGSVSRLLVGGLQKSREGIEEVEHQAIPKVQDAIERSKAAGRKGIDEAAAGVDRAAAAAISGAEKIGAGAKESARRGTESSSSGASRAATLSKQQLQEAEEKAAEYGHAAKAKVDKSVADAKSSAHNAAESIQSSGGTVDAARAAVRGVISKGIEKGKEVIGKAQTTVGLAEEKLESKGQASILSHSSAVERALHERYEKPNGLEKSVEDTLAERYQPVDARDNSVLKGV